jgi:acyl-CoA synthetase (AMP-forming)/AMP-acid ligase II
MLGLMQDQQLLVSSVLEHAVLNNGTGEIVSRLIEDGSIHRTTYGDVGKRAKQLAKALEGRGCKVGDRVATMAMNTYRHVECLYAISGLGGVAHTVNPRLFADQIDYIINHAEDKIIFVDSPFVGIFEALKDKLPTLDAIVVLTDRAHMPESTLDLVCYEELMAEADDDYSWPQFDENTATGLCYTSGTTGNPKGVLYSNRSTVLHALLANGADAFGMRSVDAMMPVVPFFHANGWAIAYAAPMAGCKLVLPGADMTGEAVYELLDTEKVSMTAAVPTVWLGLMQLLKDKGYKLPHLNKVVIGGSAAPRSMIETFEKEYDVRVFHAWGMTEMSPLGTMGVPNARVAALSIDEQIDVKCKQGRAPYTVEMKITDDDGKDLPRDGKQFGHLLVRGPSIAKAYFKSEGGNILDTNGFFDTGDVATIDADGFMQITDRSKDVIKSGGEWISSIEIENTAVGHPGVQEAAVIGIVHPKWDERPLLVCIKAEGQDPTKEDILGFLEGKIAKWWTPDDVVFVDEIPHTATGKIQKLTMREQFKDYRFPGV